ncbi:IS3 family transposase [Ignatzschineria rhizosphaerae]|uniref:IS3 family transposase n=1 Tax=Ignatzschineria rhizosphaerae TaxID=2923279 RepID=A0ABY3X765_9GAMM|nr:IS3 family transposase [Ignatzschineria rhizosphaerae]UNM97609.1 IS3 family transposase [Ignatzschineria rhizosphaerae]
MCNYLGFSRQAYYQWKARQKQKSEYEALVLDKVIGIRLQQPRLGTRKLHYLLPELGFSIGRDALFSLLKRHRMLIPRAKAYHKTTNSLHRFYKHPNLLENLEITAPEQAWVADITYFPTHNGTSYISLITDAFSRKIVGYDVSDTLKADSSARAYEMALNNRVRTGVLRHHSDRGIQYCSDQYQKIHEKHAVLCSMTEGGNCYQNALAERVNGILKNEYLFIKPDPS